VNSGDAIVGNLGYDERLSYTAIGDSVNLARRLEGLNKHYGTRILISDSTYALAKDQIVARLVDVVAVLGRTQGTSVYELVAEKGNVERAEHDFARLFDEGMQLYLSRQWEQAISVFEETSRRRPADRPSQLLLERCRAYLESPPGEDWSGVWVMDRK